MIIKPKPINNRCPHYLPYLFVLAIGICMGALAKDLILSPDPEEPAQMTSQAPIVADREQCIAWCMNAVTTNADQCEGWCQDG